MKNKSIYGLGAVAVAATAGAVYLATRKPATDAVDADDFCACECEESGETCACEEVGEPDEPEATDFVTEYDRIVTAAGNDPSTIADDYEELNLPDGGDEVAQEVKDIIGEEFTPRREYMGEDGESVNVL